MLRFSNLCLVLTVIGGALLLAMMSLFALIVATGGLYGNGSLADASLQNILIGGLVLIAGALPLGLAVTLSLFEWKEQRIPLWMVAISWIVTVIILASIVLDIVTSLGPEDQFAVMTMPSLPFAVGLFGFLVSVSRRVRTGRHR